MSPGSADNPGLPADPALATALASLAMPGVVVGSRAISAGDETALLDEESQSLAAATPLVLRASGAARLVGRDLLRKLGHPPAAMPKGLTGAPLWPPGIVGSFAHDQEVAVAALACSRDMRALGIDIEPAAMLPAGMLELVVAPRERIQLARDPFGGRLHFTVKEAVYKALHPLDGKFLDFHDIELDLTAGIATTATAHRLQFRSAVSAHIVALAFQPAQP